MFRKNKIMILCIFSVLLFGCDSQKFKQYVAEGKKALDENRYQDSIDAFNLALKEKNNDSNVEKLLDEARNNLDVQNYFIQNNKDWDTVINKDLTKFFLAIGNNNKLAEAVSQLEKTLNGVKNMKVPDNEQVEKYHQDFINWVERYYQSKQKYLDGSKQRNLKLMEEANNEQKELNKEITLLRQRATELNKKKSDDSVSNLNLKEPEVKNSDEQYPEPYKLALNQLKQGNIEDVIKYLDLTITDFPDSNFVYNANLLKSIIYVSELTTSSTLADILSTGAQKGNVLYKDEDFKLLKNYGDNLQGDFNEYSLKLFEAAEYVINYYSDDKNSLNFKNISFENKLGSRDLKSFKSVGYPIPKEDEILDYKKSSDHMLFSSLITQIIKDNKVLYSEYFKYMGYGIRGNDKISAKKYFEKVIQLTEDDKYNKSRLDAEDALKKLK